MAGQTTNGFPYPSTTDPLANGPGTIQSLAQKTDDVTTALKATDTSLDGRVAALEARPALPPGPLALTSVTTGVDPSDAFIGESLRWARVGALAVVVVTGAIRDPSTVNATVLGLTFANATALPTHVRPLAANVEQVATLSATNTEALGVRVTVQLQTGGLIYVKALTAPPTAVPPANAQFVATFVYPAAAAAP